MKLGLKALAILVVVGVLFANPKEIGYISITTQPTGYHVYLDRELPDDTINCIIDLEPEAVTMYWTIYTKCLTMGAI